MTKNRASKKNGGNENENEKRKFENGTGYCR